MASTSGSDSGLLALKHSARFRLVRHFLAFGLAGVLVAAASLIFLYRQLAMSHLIEHGGRSNADITRVISNQIWFGHRDYFRDATGRSRAELLSDPRQSQLQADVRRLMGGSSAVKFKTYGVDGVTVFSTDVNQVGEDKRANPAFQAALSGRVVSDFSRRDRFDAVEGTVSNRDLIFSYVPVLDAEGNVQAVAEIYSDVTALWAAQRQAQWQVAGLVLVLSLLLYGFLHVIVRHGDRIIRAQDLERTRHAEELRHTSRHDPLTGLPNRLAFSESLSRLLAERRSPHGALMFMDLDGFKVVNDTLGHEAGDVVLSSVAERLRRSVRDTDSVFRIGGDEFVVVAPGMADDQAAHDLAERIIARVREPIEAGSTQCAVGASIGIAFYPGDGADLETLLRHADTAMYLAKHAGKGRATRYTKPAQERDTC